MTDDQIQKPTNSVIGGNSLAETVSIGKIVGEHIGNQNPKSPQELDEKFLDMAEEHKNERASMLERDEGSDPYELISEIRNIMENYAGIKRSESRLEEGIDRIDDVEERIHNMCVNKGLKSREFEFANNAFFMIKAAKATLRSAKERKESRGAHYRTDYNEKRPEFLLNLVIESEQNGNINIREQEVGEPTDPVKKAVEQDHELDYHHLE